MEIGKSFKSGFLGFFPLSASFYTFTSTSLILTLLLVYFKAL